MPLFALANSGFVLRGMAAPSRVALGVGAGLLFGKQLGVFAFTWAAVRLGLAPMPRHSSLTQLWGVSIVTGIGFTVALFIAALAFGDDARLLNDAKLGILLGSIASGLVGYVVLRAAPSRAEAGSRRPDEDARAEARQRDRGR